MAPIPRTLARIGPFLSRSWTRDSATPPLVQLEGVPLLTDGGLETTLVFHQRIDLPGLAAFDLLRRERGHQVLTDYFRSYLSLAREACTAS